MATTTTQTLPHVVIIGAGFGGLRAARSLKGQPVRVTIVDSNNYHLFQPLLYQVATAGLSSDEIARPVRAILRGQANADFLLAEVQRIDLANRTLATSAGPLSYDYLIVAAGGANNFFGIRSMERNALPLKSIRDAEAVRNHVLRQFELASREPDPAKRRAMLTFVIIGGGPTGVECAGALAELFKTVLRKDYPRLNFDEISVILLEGTNRLLLMMPEHQSAYAARELAKRGVDVRFNTLAQNYDGETVLLKTGETIPARTVIWAAGVRANPLLASLGVELDRSGRAVIAPTLQVPSHPDVFVIGDAAALPGPDGKPLPMIAPVAIQQAGLVSANLMRQIHSQALKPFVYHDPGILATIGRSHAVANIQGISLKGILAWWVWLVVHIMQLIGFRNRMVVLVDWAWQYIFYDRALRLIEEPLGEPVRDWPAANKPAQAPEEAAMTFANSQPGESRS
jgi:NADH:ubiquinone reductase (H+-translocating)